MTLPLKTLFFGPTSKSLSILNKRHELGQLLGILATLSSVRPAPSQGSEMTSPHIRQTESP